MEQFVNKYVENTFENNSLEDAKRIIADKILWYEIKIKELEDIIDTDAMEE